jgi:hypothetical protein
MGWNSIRRLALTVLLMGAAQLVAREGEVVPSVEMGMSPDEVLDQLGSPHGRGAAGDREIWTYPHHRIVFQAGEVVVVQRSGPALTPSSPASSRGAARSEPTTPRDANLTPTASWLLSRPDPVAITEDLKPTPVFIPNPSPAQSPSAQGVAAAEPPGALKRRVADVMVYIVGTSLLVLALAALRQIRRQRPRQKRPSKKSLSVAAAGGSTLTLEQLLCFEWKRLEELTARFFSVQGWRTEQIPSGTDGSVHFKLAHSSDPNRRAYVSCKASQEDVDMMRVRDFYGSMTADGVREGWFLTTSNFTRAARSFAEGKPLKLMSGPEIVEEFGQLPEKDRKGILSGVLSRN